MCSGEKNLRHMSTSSEVSVVVRVKPTSLDSSVVHYDPEQPKVVSVKYETDSENRMCSLECDGVVLGSTSAVCEELRITDTLINECLASNRNILISCYGQSCSGKTFTMFGDNADDGGVIHAVMKHIFHATQRSRFQMSLSAFEIYGDQVLDLLPKHVNGRVQSPVLAHDGCQKVSIEHPLTFSSLIQKVQAKRTTATTSLNSNSSRSHGFVEIYIQSEKDSAQSRVTFVDLAGSEKACKTLAQGQTLKEGIQINKSLMTLGIVVRCLAMKNCTYIPWRESKLTSILRRSMQQGAHICFILCISSEVSNSSESISTLRFGSMLLNVKLREEKKEQSPIIPAQRQNSNAKPCNKEVRDAGITCKSRKASRRHAALFFGLGTVYIIILAIYLIRLTHRIYML